MSSFLGTDGTGSFVSSSSSFFSSSSSFPSHDFGFQTFSSSSSSASYDFSSASYDFGFQADPHLNFSSSSSSNWVVPNNISSNLVSSSSSSSDSGFSNHTDGHWVSDPFTLFPKCTICDQKLEVGKKSWGCVFQRTIITQAPVNACGKCYAKWAQGLLTAEESRKVLQVLLPLMDHFVVNAKGWACQDHFR